MTSNRAPRGIPTGGQFTAATFSEPNISLDRRPAYKPDHGGSQPPGLRGARKIDGEWVPETRVQRDPVTGAYSRRKHTDAELDFFVPPGVEAEAEAVAMRLNKRDGIVPKAERPVPIPPASEGDFIRWGELVPKFLRRK